MNDGELDDIVRRAADAGPDVDPALVDRLSRSVGASLEPVRPLPPQWVLAAGIMAVCLALAATGALLMGPAGVRKMDALQAGLIFPLVGALVAVAAASSSAESIPGSRRPATPWILGVAGCLALALVFGLVFPDTRAEQFVPLGIRCLAAGVVQAIPVSLGTWLILRRGFPVNPPAAGLARGLLAGLAGVFMLELHCPNFEVLHVIVWHIAVLAVCGLVGWALGRRSS